MNLPTSEQALKMWGNEIDYTEWRDHEYITIE